MPTNSPPAILSDCDALHVWPYGDPNKNYLNADTFQIISAGPDQAFGQGTNLTLNPPPVWSPQISQASDTRLQTVPPATSPPPPTGLDDFSNFYDKALGISQ
jgi:hypothetical protein